MRMKDLSTKIRQKFEFPSQRDGKSVVELRALTHGLPPKSIKRSLELFFEEWKENGVSAWNQLTESNEVFLTGKEDDKEKNRPVGWWNLPAVVGDRFISRLINAPKRTCIMIPNASLAVLSLLSCKELHNEKKRKVVCTDGEFPAVLHSLHHYNRQFEGYSEDVRKQAEFSISMVEIGSDPFDADKVIAQIDDETCLVIFSHIGFVRGERISDEDIKRVAIAAHAHNALIAIDGYHALGNQVIDVQSIDVDIYFGGLLKEGCGSAGNCYLYIKKGLELTPSLSGWFGDKDPFAFKHKPTTHESIRNRFLTGTTPIAPLYHAVEGLKIMFDVGLQEVSDDVLGKVEMMTNLFIEADIDIVSSKIKKKMSSLIVLRVEDANKLRDYLIQEYAIMVDARKNEFLRLAPHIYNSVEELQFASQKIIEVIQSEKYLEINTIGQSGPVT